MYAFKTYRKIDVAINGVYAYSTSAYQNHSGAGQCDSPYC